jgi:hypothetical protein
MSTIVRVVMRAPGISNLINTFRMVKPVVLKTKVIGFRDIRTNNFIMAGFCLPIEEFGTLLL